MIEVRGLYKYFEHNEVLTGVDVDLKDGEILTILGASGGGKSVLLKNIAGLMKPDRGSIRIDGREITLMKGGALRSVQRDIGMMFQGGALFDSMTVAENVAFGLRRLTDLSRAEIYDKVRYYLDIVRLNGVDDKLPEDISIGMKRRVALARAIATQPKYIFYDEPTTGLDPITTDAICDLFRDMKETHGVTSIIVTHDLNTAFKVSDRIALLYEGKIEETASAGVFRKSSNPRVRDFIEKGFKT